MSFVLGDAGRRENGREHAWLGSLSWPFAEHSSGFPLCTTDDPHRFSPVFICMRQLVPVRESSRFRQYVWFKMQECVWVCVYVCEWSIVYTWGLVSTRIFFLLLLRVTIVTKTFDITPKPFPPKLLFFSRSYDYLTCLVLQMYVQYLYVNIIYSPLNITLLYRCFFISE